MDSGSEQIEKEPRAGLTLRRILICSAILAVVVVAIAQFSNYRREVVRKGCLVRFANLNKALGLYRADADGFSPCYDRKEVVKPDVKLSKYTGSESILCPKDSEFHPHTLRIASGGKISSVSLSGARSVSFYAPFGVEEASVVATCENHIQYKSQYSLSRWPNILVRREVLTGGTTTVLLRNGTAKLVSFGEKRRSWQSHNGVFTLPKDRPKSWTSFANSELFDFEPKPPAYEY